MIQYILIGLVFVGALAYLGRIVYRQFTRSECESGCGKCNQIDVNKIEKQLRERGI